MTWGADSSVAEELVVVVAVRTAGMGVESRTRILCPCSPMSLLTSETSVTLEGSGRSLGLGMGSSNEGKDVTVRSGWVVP